MICTVRERVLRLHKEGKSYNEIVKIVGCSKGTVYWYCNKKAKKNYLLKQRARRKKDVIDLKKTFGGKCTLCGYNKCLAALQFHHKNELTKFRVKYPKGRTRYGVTGLLHTKNKKTAYNEAKKCILVCANCHSEIHAGVATTQ